MSQNTQNQEISTNESTLQEALQKLKDDPSSLVELPEEELINIIGGAYAKVLAMPQRIRQDQVIIL